MKIFANAAVVLPFKYIQVMFYHKVYKWHFTLPINSQITKDSLPFRYTYQLTYCFTESVLFEKKIFANFFFQIKKWLFSQPYIEERWFSSDTVITSNFLNLIFKVIFFQGNRSEVWITRSTRSVTFLGFWVFFFSSLSPFKKILIESFYMYIKWIVRRSLVSVTLIWTTTINLSLSIKSSHNFLLLPDVVQSFSCYVTFYLIIIFFPPYCKWLPASGSVSYCWKSLK